MDTTWLNNEQMHSTNSDLSMNEQEQKTDMGLVTHTLKKLFWPTVAALNGLLLIDVVFNGGKGLIWLLFFLTGGYSG